MTRKEAIEMVKQVLIELNRRPDRKSLELNLEETIVASLIALEVLKVDDEA